MGNLFQKLKRMKAIKNLFVSKKAKANKSSLQWSKLVGENFSNHVDKETKYKCHMIISQNLGKNIEMMHYKTKTILGADWNVIYGDYPMAFNTKAKTYARFTVENDECQSDAEEEDISKDPECHFSWLFKEIFFYR